MLFFHSHANKTTNETKSLGTKWRKWETNGWWPFLERGMCLQGGKLAEEVEFSSDFVPFLFSFTWALFYSFRTSTHPTSGLFSKTKVTLSNNGAKDSFCTLALRFISSQQAETHWLKSVPVPNSNFYTPGCLKHGSSRQIFSHLQPMLHTYSAKLYLLTIDRISRDCKDPKLLLPVRDLWLRDSLYCCWVTSPRHTNNLQDPPRG